MRPGFAVLLLSSTLVLLPAASGAYSSWAWTFDIRRDPINDNYLTGYLSWNGGKGGIEWGPDLPSDDLAPWLPDANSAASAWVENSVGWNARTYTGSDEVGGRRFIRVLEFKSAPLPDTYILNVSRGIAVDLYFKSSKCVSPEIELWAGTTFLAGQVASQTRQSNGKFFYSPTISGFCGRPYGMHTEVSILAKGTVLTLKMILHNPGAVEKLDVPVLLGTKDRSVIRLPFYIPEERVFLESHATGSGASPAGEPGGAAPPGAILLPLALVGLALRPSRRLRAPILAALLLAAALAGCLGGSSAPRDTAGTQATGGRVNQTLVPVPGGGNATSGGILGIVHDEFQVPVQGVHVSLFGTDKFATTDNFGQFAFSNVTAGEYTIRLDRAGWKVLEEKVTVEAGKFAKLDVLLEPLVKKSGGANRHRHDYWLPDEKVRTIFSGPVTFPPFQGQVPACASGSSSSGDQYFCVTDFLIPPAAGSEPRKLVLPGTNDLEVKVTWQESQNRVYRVGVGFTANDNKSDFYMFPKPSGVPTHIRTTWGMGDVGHQAFTTWALWLYIPTNEHEVFFGEGAPIVQPLQGPFQVEVKVHRGTAPLEPGHKDHWGSNTTLTLMEREQSSSWPLSKLVPPGTESLDITYEQTRPSSNEWTVVYKPANEAPTAVANFHPLPGGTKNGNTVTFHYVLKPGEADPFYAKRSSWSFGRVQLNPDPVKTQQDNLDARLNGENKAFLTVVANKDPGFSAEDE